MLSHPDRNHYDLEGYLVLPGILDRARVAAVAQELEMWQRQWPAPDPKNLRFRFRNDSQTQALSLDAIDPVWDLLPGAAAIAHDPAIAQVLTGLFGEPARLFKDKLILKAPRVDGYPLHQDYIPWSDFPRSFTTLVAPLEEATVDNGCIEIFPRLHQRGYLSPLDGNFHDLPETAVQGVEGVKLVLRPGDIALFNCFTPHRSAPNRSGRSRRQLYFSYNRLSDMGDFRRRYYERYFGWLLSRYRDFGAQGFYFQ